MQICLENILNICIQYRWYVLRNLVRIILVVCISIIQAYALHSKDNFYRGFKYAKDLNTVAPPAPEVADVVVLNCVGGRIEGDVYFSNSRKRKPSTCVKSHFTIHLYSNQWAECEERKRGRVNIKCHNPSCLFSSFSLSALKTHFPKYRKSSRVALPKQSARTFITCIKSTQLIKSLNRPKLWIFKQI